MPVYEVGGTGELLPFRRLHATSGLYEKDLETILWENLDELRGEALFRVARQPTLAGGGRPDIVALDQQARVVVIEVKREMDRGQLAQCLEYAGWARSASLDDLSSLYHSGARSFFVDWQEFTGSLSPAVINKSPRLILVARWFHGRTGEALDFLRESGLSVEWIPISMYVDSNGRRLVDIEGDRDPAGAVALPVEAAASTEVEQTDRGRIRLSDLLDAKLLYPGEKLVWRRRNLGTEYRAEVTPEGFIRLENGESFSSPSRAAIEAAGMGSYDGWNAWKVERLDGQLLADVRAAFLQMPGAITG